MASKTSLANDCDASHIVSLRGLLKPISSVKWKKDSWMSHLFGTILRPSLTENFTDWWTSSLQDTLANRSLPQESEQERKTQDTCGLGSQTEFGFSDQECASLRMSRDTSRWDSPASSATWKSWVTRCRGEYSLRVKLAHLTSGSGSSSWPTSNARDWKDGDQQCNQRAIDAGHQITLGRAVTCWPTPQTSDTNGAASSDRPAHRKQLRDVEHGLGLPAPANHSTDGSRQESWGTPRSCSAMAATISQEAVENTEKRYQSNLETQMVTRAGAGAGAKLNPRWVETLMGLPIGWTMPSCTRPVIIEPMNCDCLETESSQPPQNEHLEH